MFSPNSKQDWLMDNIWLFMEKPEDEREANNRENNIKMNLFVCNNKQIDSLYHQAKELIKENRKIQ